MDKPNIPVKDWIIRNMSVDMQIYESIIGAVINHEFNSAREAMQTCDSLEFSGFGKFYFNRRKAEKKMLKFLETKDAIEKKIDAVETPQERASLQYKLQKLMGDINVLKPKMDENRI